MKGIILALTFILIASSVRAEEPTPAWAPGTPRKVADYTSTGIVAGMLAQEFVHDLKQPDRKQALLKSGLRIGGTVAVSEIVKRLFPRIRPDGSDNKSFWSEHTAVAAATSGLNIQFAVPLGTTVGYLRQAANKHHPTDVIVGALVGALSHSVVK